MRLRHIEVFNAVMQTGSVSAAARLINITQPAVSRTLQHAELQLGFALFQRARGRLTPTNEALALFPHIEKLFEQLDRFGVPRRISGFMLPLGYSFNLDGSMVYTTFLAIFIAQAYGIDMTLTAQITMLLVLMVSSKGIAGVPRASLVVVAAVLPMFGLPEAGILLILGIDHFLDMGRTLTNVLGNAIATAVVAKWEGAVDPNATTDDDESLLPMEHSQEGRPAVSA